MPVPVQAQAQVQLLVLAPERAQVQGQVLQLVQELALPLVLGQVRTEAQQEAALTGQARFLRAFLGKAWRDLRARDTQSSHHLKPPRIKK